MRIIVHIWPVSCNETVLENYAFLVYMHYTHPGYQTSICGKNRAYYIQIFTVSGVGGCGSRKEEVQLGFSLAGVSALSYL